MSSLDKDRRRRVSEPTEADFIKGFAHNVAGKGHTTSVILAALLAASFFGKGRQRGK